MKIESFVIFYCYHLRVSKEKGSKYSQQHIKIYFILNNDESQKLKELQWKFKNNYGIFVLVHAVF